MRPASPVLRRSSRRVVALGGGHGLAATLSASRHLDTDITAVVTVADNGGSSGRLRDELGVLPPGDLRQALTALCGDDEWGRTWARVLRHRFKSAGALHEHVVGNLLIVALWELLEDHVGGLDLVDTLLGARGRVLPMSAVPVDITAQVHDRGAPAGTLRTVRGQVEVATVGPDVVSVELEPADPPGETEGFTAGEHLDVLAGHAPDLGIDVVIADPRSVSDQAALAAAAGRLGADLVVDEVAVGDGSDRHDPLRLASAFGEIMDRA